MLSLPRTKAETKPENSQTKALPTQVDSALALRQSAPSSELPHINQGKGTSLCGVTVFLMALQRETGFKLNNPILLTQLGSVVLEKVGTGQRSLDSEWLFDPLNLPYVSKDYNSELKLQDLGATEALALSVIREVIIPELQKGNYVRLSVTSSSRSHAILLTGYDQINDRIIVNDPLEDKAKFVSADSLAKMWPVQFPEELRKKFSDFKEDRFYLRSTKIEFPKPPEFIDVPMDAVVKISGQELSKFSMPMLTLARLNGREEASGQKILGNQANWKMLSKFWDNERDVTKAIGVATIARLQVAKGEPPLMLYHKNDQELAIVAVTGYKGGYCGPEGEIQLSMLHEGKVFAKWISVKDFLQKCSPQQSSGRFHCYIGYPAVSLREGLKNR